MPILTEADQEVQLHPSSLCAGEKSILLRNSWPRGPQLCVGYLKMRHDTRCVCLRTTMWQVATSSQPRMEMESGSGERSLLNIQKALGSYLRGRLTFEKSGSFLHKQRGSVVVPGSRVEPPGSRCSSGWQRQDVSSSRAACPVRMRHSPGGLCTRGPFIISPAHKKAQYSSTRYSETQKDHIHIALLQHSVVIVVVYYYLWLIRKTHRVYKVQYHPRFQAFSPGFQGLPRQGSPPTF